MPIFRQSRAISQQQQPLNGCIPNGRTKNSTNLSRKSKIRMSHALPMRSFFCTTYPEQERMNLLKQWSEPLPGQNVTDTTTIFHLLMCETPVALPSFASKALPTHCATDCCSWRWPGNIKQKLTYVLPWAAIPRPIEW